MGSLRNGIGALLCAVVWMLLAGCSTLNVGAPPQLAEDGRWALLPIANFTETPDAGERVGSIAESVLIQRGLSGLQRYPVPGDDEAFLAGSTTKTLNAALDWAGRNGMRYALGGSVQEWRYKTGVDGEPAVTLTFNLYDLRTGHIIWSGTGSRSGWSRASLGATGQQLIGQLLTPLTAH